MIEITIPGFGMAKLEHLVSDFTGTLSIDGRLIPGVKEQLNTLAEFLSLHIITADTFGTAREELRDLPLKTVVITGEDQDIQKEDYIKKLGQDHVVAVGNGNNDRRMLNSARLGIAVIEEEGASAQAIMAATVVVRSITDAFALLLNPTRCTATLRF